jgi:protease I
MGAKRVAVLLEQQYQDLEIWVPYYRLKEAGFEAVLLGPEKGKTYPGKFGYPAVAEADYASAKAKDFAGVVVPGGFAPDFMRRTPDAAKFVGEIFKAGKPTAAICHGAWILSSAGVLKGKKATCFFAIADDVKNAGASYVDAACVVDGNLITSRKPEDLPAFCAALIRSLS